MMSWKDLSSKCNKASLLVVRYVHLANLFNSIFLNANGNLWQLFVTSYECAVPFLDNFEDIHDWVEQKYERKALVVVDTEDILTFDGIMNVLKHRTVINGGRGREMSMLFRFNG